MEKLQAIVSLRAAGYCQAVLKTPFPDSVRLNFSQDHAAAVAAVERIATLIDRYRALVA